MDKIERFAGAVARNFAQAGLILLLVFAGATLLDGLGRGLLSRPIDGVRDMGHLVVSIALSACFPFVLMERGNVAITFITSFVSNRANWLLDAFAAILTGVVIAAFARQFFVHALDLMHGNESTPLLRIPKAPFWFLVAFNFALASVAQLIVTMQTIHGTHATNAGEHERTPADVV
jgi:TRAP-type transport system small permease protein